MRWIFAAAALALLASSPVDAAKLRISKGDNRLDDVLRRSVQPSHPSIIKKTVVPKQIPQADMKKAWEPRDCANGKSGKNGCSNGQPSRQAPRRTKWILSRRRRPRQTM